jgi:hypothetical protein
MRYYPQAARSTDNSIRRHDEEVDLILMLYDWRCDITMKDS